MEKRAKQEQTASQNHEADSKRNHLSALTRLSAVTALSLLPLTAQAAETPDEPVRTELAGELDIEFNKETQAKDPLVRSVHQGIGPVDIAKSMLDEAELRDKQLVFELTADMLESAGFTRPVTLEDLKDDEYRVIPKGTQFATAIDKTGRRTHKVEKGDTASQLYKELGWKDAGATFEDFLRGNAVVSPDQIYKDEVMLYAPGIAPLEAQATAQPEPKSKPSSPPASQPDTPPVLPPGSQNSKTITAEQPQRTEPEIDEPPEPPSFNEAAAEIKTLSSTSGNLDIDEAEIKFENSLQLSEAEAKEALDLLTAAAFKVENPNASLDSRFNEQPLPADISGHLMRDRQNYLFDLMSGESNVANIQHEIIDGLSAAVLAESDLEAKKIVAAQMVDYVAEINDWTFSEEEKNTYAGLMLRGAASSQTRGLQLANIEGLSVKDFDEVSLTLDHLNNSILGHMEEQIILVEKAEVQLEELAPELLNLSQADKQTLVGRIIETNKTESIQTDYLYATLEAKLGPNDMMAGLKMVGMGVLSSRQSADFVELFPSIEQAFHLSVENFISQPEGKELSVFTDEISQMAEAKHAGISAYSEELGKLQADLDELNPDFPVLTGEQLYEISKVITSQNERGKNVADDWYQLVVAKAHLKELTIQESVTGLVEGVYRALSASDLLSYENERQSVDSGVTGFVDSESYQLKSYLESTYENLETRLLEAEGKVQAIIQSIQAAVPEITLNEGVLRPLAVARLRGMGDSKLVETVVADYERTSGRKLNESQTAKIELEKIKLNTDKGETRLLQISTFLQKHYGAKSALNHIGGPTGGGVAFRDYDPVIQTLAIKVAEGEYHIDYPQGSLDIFSTEFEDMLRAYDTIPSSLFPGQQLVVEGYDHHDLTPLFEYLGLDTQKIINSPFNAHLREADGEIIAEHGWVWFDASLWSGGSKPNFEGGVDWVYGDIPGFSYTVKKGDSLKDIAGKFKLIGNDEVIHPTVTQIMEWNRGRIADADLITPGQEIVIPINFAPYVVIPETAANQYIPGSTTKSPPAPAPATPEDLPAEAKIARAELGSLGTIEIIQLNGTFQTSREMKPTAIINHWTGGDYEDSDPLSNFLRGIKGNKACNGGCSVHFFISEQGTIYQLSDLDSHLAHAKGANSFGVGIEIEGSWGDDGMPANVQYQAALRLNAYLVQELGLRLDHSLDNKSGILGHYEVDGSHLDKDNSGKSDPGKRFLKQIREDIGKWAGHATASSSRPEASNGNLADEHDRIKGKVAKELASLPTFDNPFGLTAGDISPPEKVFTVDELARNRLDKDATGNSWEHYIGPSEGAREVMEALIVYGGLHEIDAPGWTDDELLIAATATYLGEGGGYTHIVGDLKLKGGAKLDPADNISWKDEIKSISTSSEQYYWTQNLDGSFRDPELVGNDHRIAANRAGRMIREELAAGRPILDKWHYYRDWEEEHKDGYLNLVETAEDVLASIKAGG